MRHFLILISALALFAADTPKPTPAKPVASMELRKNYFKIANARAEWQAKLYQAQAALLATEPDYQRAIADLRVDCEKQGADLSEEKDREPICVARPEPPKKAEPKK